MRTCWKCQTTMPDKERYCEHCGADQWNRPQGAGAAPPIANVGATAPVRYATHPNVVAGITVLAVLAIFSTAFWIVWGIFVVLNPPEASYESPFVGSGSIAVVALADYFTMSRVGLPAVIAAAITFLVWNAVVLEFRD